MGASETDKQREEPKGEMMGWLEIYIFGSSTS